MDHIIINHIYINSGEEERKNAFNQLMAVIFCRTESSGEIVFYF